MPYCLPSREKSTEVARASSHARFLHCALPAGQSGLPAGIYLQDTAHVTCQRPTVTQGTVALSMQPVLGCGTSKMSQEAHRRLAGHVAPVLCCALQADGHTVLSGGEDGAVCVFDLRQGAAVHRIGLARGGEAVPSLAVHPGEPHTAFAACGRAVQVLDLRQVCGGPPLGGQARQAGCRAALS